MNEFMRKLMMGILIAAIVIGIAASIWLYFYEQRKSPDNVPSLQLITHSEEETGVTIEPLDAIVPALQVNGQVYYFAGESWFGARCGMMDGEITSTVECWEMPNKDNQSNFGKYGYQYGNEGFIEVLQDGTWYSYGTRSDKGRVLYKDWWFDLEYISDDSLKWLAWYNEQPETIQELVYVPTEFRDPYHLSATEQIHLDRRKTNLLDKLHNLDYQEGYYDILPEYSIEFDAQNVFGINEIEMLIWRDGKAAEISEELYAEMKDIGLLKYYQMEDGRWKYQGNIYDQMIELVGRTPNAVKDSCFTVLTNDPDVTFEEIHKHLISSSISDRLGREETVVVEMRVLN